jgi:hypothetical protein
MSATRIAILALLGDPLLESLVDTRIYAVSAPQGATFPYLVVSLVSELDEQMLAGAGVYPEARVSIACVAKSAAEADAIGEAVKLAIQDTTNAPITDGESPPGFSATATIMKEATDFQDHSDDRSVFRRVMDFSVRWRLS